MAAWIGDEKENREPGAVRLTNEQMDMLGELADSGNEYWEKVQGFILRMKNRELSSLSDAQVDWYYNISASLNREIDLREARIAFGEDSEQFRAEKRRIGNG